MKRPATILAALVIALSACTGEQASNPSSSSATTGGTDATTPSSSTAPIATEAPAALPSADVFIAPDGDDAAPGTVDRPVGSLPRALEIVPRGGTVIFTAGVHEGGYQLADLTGVTIRGMSGAVLDGGGTEPLGIYCDGCRDVTIVGLEIRGFTDIGVGATNSTGLTLRSLEVHGNGNAVQLVDWELEGYGIHVDFSSSVTIEGNDVYENGPDPPILPDRILGTGIDTFGNTDVMIRGNSSYENHGGGILVEDSFRVVVEGNQVFGNDLDASIDEWWDGGLWLDGGDEVVVRGNVFRDNAGPGIEISDEDGQSPTGYVLIDNVSTGNYFGIFIWNFGTDGFPPPDVLTLEGNNFTGNERLDVWIEADLE